MPRLKWTRDRILLELRRLDARGERLSARRMRAIGLGGMVTTAYRLFGSWREALEEAGVEAPASRPRKWTLERIVVEVRRLASEGQDVSYAAMRGSSPRLVQAAYRHPELGNWSKALEAAGLAPEKYQKRKRWSRQKIIEEVQAMEARAESLAFAAARDSQPNLVSVACSGRHFGSWAKAVAAAGFDYESFRRRRRWTRERILATIKRLHAKGDLLTAARLKESGQGALVVAARKPSMFGSWRDAVECAGIDYEEVRRAGTMS